MRLFRQKNEGIRRFDKKEPVDKTSGHVTEGREMMKGRRPMSGFLLVFGKFVIAGSLAIIITVAAILAINSTRYSYGPGQHDLEPRTDSSASSNGTGRGAEFSLSKMSTVDTKRVEGYDPLVSTWNGLTLKLIALKKGVRCASRPDGDASGLELQLFRSYAIFDTYPSDHKYPSVYLVGNGFSKGSILGWVRNTDVIRWDMRVYDSIPDGGQLSIYRSYNDAVDALRRVRQNPLCVIDARSPGGKARFPVLSKKVFTDSGKRYELHEIALLPEGDGQETIPKAGSQPAGKDIVFVAENTIGCSAAVQKIGDAVRRLEESLESSRRSGRSVPRIRCGLVEFSDWQEGTGSTGSKPWRSSNFSVSLRDFLWNLSGIGPSRESDPDIPDAVYDALNAAMSEMSWLGEIRPRKEEMEGSGRAIVLVTNSPGHEPGSRKNPQGLSPYTITLKANVMGIRFFPVILPNNALTGEPDRIAREYEDLAGKTGGRSLFVQDESMLGDRIYEIIGEITKIAARRESEFRATAGWICASIDRSDTVEREIQVTREEAEETLRELFEIERSFWQDPAVLERLRDLSIRLRAGEPKRAGTRFGSPDQSLISKIPFGPKCILDKASWSFRNLTQQEKDSIKSSLGEFSAAINKALSDPSLFPSGLARDQSRFLKESIFP